MQFIRPILQSAVIARARHTFRLCFCVIAGLLLHVTPAAAATQYTGDLIIKWRSGAGTQTSSLTCNLASSTIQLVQSLGASLQLKRVMSGGLQLLQTGLVEADAILAVAASVALDGCVAYAVPDQQMTLLATPNDPRFPNQNNLQGSQYVSGGANAPAAWDVSKGAASVVVAVVDTGYTDHPDLSRKILPGYNFISDPMRSGDGDGRDADAHDLGDGVTSTEAASLGGDCTARPSSWHGTQVMSVLAADTNNGLGMAGVSWNTQIVPVRAVGKCGGLMSDVVDGMLWAGGFSVPGVPANANPARVINMSVGADGNCTAAEQDAVDQLTAAGVTVVAAAGNQAGQVQAPANCNGVIAVTAHTDSGEIASYANVGPQVALSAPGGGCPKSKADSRGNCTGSPSVILTESNAGQMGPGMPMDSTGAGTSFAAPEVAGTVALMLSIQPRLSNAQIVSALKQSARPHPAGSYCAAYAGQCGAGLLDMAGAVAQAQAALPSNAAVDTAKSVAGSGGGGGAFDPVDAALLLLASLATAFRKKQ
nr:S8 family peptidase [Ralstonia sp. UBA689]